MNTPTPSKNETAVRLYDEAQVFEGSRPSGLLIQGGDEILRLERELATVTEQLKDANERITELKSDRSILTQDGERWREIAIRMQHQRDTLAEALKWVGGFAYAGGKSFAEVEPVESALQTLNQPQPTKPEPR